MYCHSPAMRFDIPRWRAEQSILARICMSLLLFVLAAIQDKPAVAQRADGEQQTVYRYQVWGTSTLMPTWDRPWSTTFDTDLAALLELQSIERGYAPGRLMESTSDKPEGLYVKKVPVPTESLLNRAWERAWKVTDFANELKEGKEFAEKVENALKGKLEANEKALGDFTKTYIKGIAGAYDRAKQMRKPAENLTKSLIDKRFNDVNRLVGKTKPGPGDGLFAKSVVVKPSGPLPGQPGSPKLGVPGRKSGAAAERKPQGPGQEPTASAGARPAQSARDKEWNPFVLTDKTHPARDKEWNRFLLTDETHPARDKEWNPFLLTDKTQRAWDKKQGPFRQKETTHPARDKEQKPLRLIETTPRHQAAQEQLHRQQLAQQHEQEELHRQQLAHQHEQEELHRQQLAHQREQEELHRQQLAQQRVAERARLSQLAGEIERERASLEAGERWFNDQFHSITAGYRQITSVRTQFPNALQAQQSQLDGALQQLNWSYEDFKRKCNIFSHKVQDYNNSLQRANTNY